MSKEIEKLSNESALKIYLRDISKWSNLTKEEEDFIWRNKSPEKIEKLVNSHLRLVVKIVTKTIGANKKNISESDYLDLIQAGNVGLLKAVQTFEPEKNIKFSTYAYNWISTYIKNELNDKKCGLIKKPSYVISSFSIINKATKIMTTIMDREPTMEEIQGVLNGVFTEEKFKELVCLKNSGVIYTTEVNGETISVIDTIKDSFEEKVEAELKMSDLQKSLKGALNPKLHLLICARFGLGEYQDNPCTLDQVAELLVEKGFNDRVISVERVRQLEEQAINILRKDPNMLAFLKG